MNDDNEERVMQECRFHGKTMFVNEQDLIFAKAIACAFGQAERYAVIGGAAFTYGEWTGKAWVNRNMRPAAIEGFRKAAQHAVSYGAPDE